MERGWSEGGQQKVERKGRVEEETVYVSKEGLINVQ